MSDNGNVVRLAGRCQVCGRELHGRQTRFCCREHQLEAVNAARRKTVPGPPGGSGPATRLVFGTVWQQHKKSEQDLVGWIDRLRMEGWSWGDLAESAGVSREAVRAWRMRRAGQGAPAGNTAGATT